MRRFTLYFQSSAVVETLEKKQRNVAKFLGSILHHAISFSMLWVRAAIGIRWHCNTLQIVNILKYINLNHWINRFWHSVPNIRLVLQKINTKIMQISARFVSIIYSRGLIQYHLQLFQASFLWFSCSDPTIFRVVRLLLVLVQLGLFCQFLNLRPFYNYKKWRL